MTHVRHDGTRRTDLRGAGQNNTGHVHHAPQTHYTYCMMCVTIGVVSKVEGSGTDGYGHRVPAWLGECSGEPRLCDSHMRHIQTGCITRVPPAQWTWTRQSPCGWHVCLGSLGLNVVLSTGIVIGRGATCPLLTAQDPALRAACKCPFMNEPTPANAELLLGCNSPETQRQGHCDRATESSMPASSVTTTATSESAGERCLQVRLSPLGIHWAASQCVQTICPLAAFREGGDTEAQQGSAPVHETIQGDAMVSWHASDYSGTPPLPAVACNVQVKVVATSANVIRDGKVVATEAGTADVTVRLPNVSRWSSSHHLGDVNWTTAQPCSGTLLVRFKIGERLVSPTVSFRIQRTSVFASEQDNKAFVSSTRDMISQQMVETYEERVGHVPVSRARTSTGTTALWLAIVPWLQELYHEYKSQAEPCCGRPSGSGTHPSSGTPTGATVSSVADLCKTSEGASLLDVAVATGQTSLVAAIRKNWSSTMRCSEFSEPPSRPSISHATAPQATRTEDDISGRLQQARRRVCMLADPDELPDLHSLYPDRHDWTDAMKACIAGDAAFIAALLQSDARLDLDARDEVWLLCNTSTHPQPTQPRNVAHIFGPYAGRKHSTDASSCHRERWMRDTPASRWS